MEMDDIFVNLLYWIKAEGHEIVKVKVVSLDPLKVRFPNGHIDQAFPEELEKI